LQKWLRRGVLIGLAGVLVLAVLVARAVLRVRGRTLIEFRIFQNVELIRFSDFGEPPQFAIWLEDPVGGRLRTVCVTRRSATGQWEGKAECPSALPRWFEIYRQETGRTDLPTPQAPAPDAITAATPKAGQFAWRVEVEPGSHWLCWLEVNLAADFNEAFQRYDEETGSEDTHLSGQPPLLYRGEVSAVVGRRVVPEIHGQTIADTFTGEVARELKGVTTAKDIFKSVEIRVVRPPIKLF